MNRKLFTVLLIGLMGSLSALAQNQVIGAGFTNGWTYPTDAVALSPIISGTYGVTLNPKGTGNQYFRMVAGGNQQSPSLGCVSGADQDISLSPETVITAANTNCTNGAYYINCPNTTDNYVFKTPGAGGSQFVYFRVQGTVRTVSAVSQNPSVVDYSQAVTVTATLSGALATGQAVYLRYTTSSWISSTVVAMAGAGTTYTGTIPAQATGTPVSYYVFTSGTSNVAANGSNADLYTINLNNNGGPNYSYTTSYVSAATGNWNTGATWVGGAVPPAGVTATIAATHNVTVDVSTANVSVAVNSTGTLTLNTSLNPLNIQASGSLVNNGTISANSSNILFNTGATLTNNGTFNAGTGTVYFLGSGTIGGSTAITFAYLNINGAVTISTTPTITNFLTMGGGSLTAGPIYAVNSSLIYNTGGATSRGNEWSFNGIGTAGSSPGYPFNISVTGGTTLDINSASGVPRACAGTLTINNGNTVNFNAMNAIFTAANLTVTGTLSAGTMSAAMNITNAIQINGTGAMTLSSNAAGDLNLGGSFTNNGTFTHNNRTVTINGSGGQSLFGTLNGAGATNCFYNLVVNKSASNLTLFGAVNVTNALTLTNGLLLTAGQTLTVTNTANTGVSGGNTASYIRGTLTWNIASNPGTNYVFPVGLTAYTPFTLNAPTGTLPVIAVSAFSTGPTGTADGTSLTALSSTEYWTANILGGSFTGSTVSLGRQSALVTLNVIGRSTTNAALSYAALGGTAVSPNINNSNNTGASLGYFVMAQSVAAPTITNTTSNTPTIAGQANNSGYYGQTININGTNFVSTGMTVTINGVAATSVTYVSATQLTCVVANTGAAATNLNLVVTNTNTAGTATLSTFNFLGHVTNAAASYTTNTTWLGNVQPAAGATVTIAHSPVTLSAAANSTVLATVLSGANLTVAASGSITATTVTNSGTVTFTGATGAMTVTTFTNGGTLSWTAAGTLNIAAGGTLTNNATFTGGTGTVNFAGAGTVNGTTAITFNNITINTGAVTLNTASTKIDGVFTINGGNVGNTGVSPIYTANSTLYYNTTYTRYLEWSATGVGNIGTTVGYPNNVTINSGTLTVYNAGDASPNTARAMAGNLQVNTGTTFTTGALNAICTVGGSLTTSGIGAVSMSTTNARLAVVGALTNNGTITLSSTASGDLYVGGNFTNSGTFTNNSRTVFFNGTGAQTITGATTFTGITNSNTSNTVSVASGSTITITGTGTFNTASTNFTVNGTFKNLGTGTLGATLNTTTNNFIIGATGTYEHAPTFAATGNLGTIPTATWNAGSICLISGLTSPNAGSWFSGGAAQTFSNFTWNTTSLSTAPNMSGSTLTVSNIFTMTSTGTASGLRLGTNSNGTISCGTFIQNGGTLELAAGTGTGTINCTGDFSLNAGTITQSGGSITCIIQFTGTSNQNITIGGGASFGPGSSTINVRVNNAAGVTITNGTTLTINGNASTLYRKNGIITLAGTGVIAYAASNSYLEYDGTTAINTRSEEWPTTNPPANLWISNTAGVNLHAARTLTGVLTMNAGILSLGNFNLTLSNTASGAITNVSAYSATNMVQQNGTGQLLRAIATTGLPISYLYPVGETTYYTPITFNFSVNSISRNVGVLVVDALPTNWNSPATPTDYISRYWATSNSAGGSYSYTTTLSYASTGDLNGTAANLKISKYVTSNWSDFASSVAGQTVTGSGSMTEATADLAGAQLTARNSSLSYTWNGSSSSSWALASNWTPNAVPTSQDNITINVPGTNTLNITDARSITNLALSGTGTFNIASTGTLTVSGSFTNTSTAVLPLNADCASTVFFNSSGAQTIPALKFGNLNLVGGNRTLANGGAVSICGSYTPSAGTTTTTGNIVDFNGTAAQAILTNAANFRNLVISNTGGGTNTAGDLLGKNVTAGVNVNVTNNLAINSGSRLDIGANTLTLTGSTGNTVSGYLRNAGTITGATAANLTFNGSGTYEHNFTTTAGTIPTANWTPAGGTSTCYVMGYTSNTNPPASNSIGQTFYNLTWECKNQASTCNVQFNVACPTINGNLNVLNTNGNIFRLQSSGTYNLTVKGDLVINSSTSNTTLNVNNTGTKPNIYLGGDLYVVQSSAIALLSSSSQQTNIVFNKASGTQKIYQTGDIQSPVCFTIGNGTTNTVQLQNDLTLSSTNAGSCTVTSGASLDFQNFILSAQNNYDFIVNSGGTLITANANGIYPAPTPTGSVQNIGAVGTRQFNAAANYTYNGSSAQNTGTALTAAAKLTIDNSAGVTLDADVAISGTVVLTNGKLSLAAYHLTVPSSASITGYTAAKFIETSGTGELRIPVTTGSAIIFPVGSGTEYMPASFTFTSNSTARNLHVRAVKPRNTNDASTTDYINNRWWNTDLSVSSGTYAYSSSFTYISGDLVGTAVNIRLNKWDGASWTEDAGSSVNTGLLTINSGSLTQATGSLAATAQWVGRKYNNQIYTWTNAVNGSWLSATNWTPNGIPWSGDGVIFNKAGSYTVSNMPTGITLTQFTVTNSTLNVQSSAAGTLNISKAGPAVPQFSVASGASLTIDGSNAVTLNLLTQATGSVGGSLSLQKTTHKVTVADANGLVFPSGGYFAGGSISNTGFSGNPFGSTGTNGAVIFQSGSICEAFEGANPFGTAITDIISTFNTGSLYRYSDPSVGSPSVSGRTYANFEFNANKTTSLTGANAFVCDNFTVTLGTLNLNITATPGHRIKGNIVVASGATLTFTPASAGTINLNSGGTQTISGAGTFTVNANSTVDIGAGTTVSLQKNMNVAGSGNININGTLVAVGENYIASTGTVTLNSGGILSMGSADGIQTGGAIGNVRNTTFTYNAGGHFTYSGAYNQNTGNRLPTTVTGNLTVANTGSSGNNTVTLTTTNTTVNNFNLTSGLFAAGAAIKQLNIATGGTVTATAGDFATGSTAGILNFPGSGSFTGSCNPYDVYLSGGVNFGAGTVTIQNGGSLRINTGGFANTNGPFYANGSTLLYNTGASFTAGTEWYALFTSGRGVPYDVQIGNSGVNNSILDFGASTAWRYCRNNFYIGNSVGGTGYQFKLSSNSGGDLKIGGNWQRYANGSFTTNNRAVFFVGNGNTQTITANSGAETFAYFVVDKASGNVQINNSPATTVTVNGSAGGNVLQLVQGDINLNGQIFNLGGAGGYFNVVGALRQVYSATAATFNVIGYKEITSTTSGTLKFDDQTTVVISNGLNFGPNVTTVNATLRIDAGGYADINAPIYGPNGILIYNTGGNYDRRVEWNGVEGTAGFPNDVIVNNSTLYAGGPGGSFVSVSFGARRDVTINSAGSIIMNGSNMLVPLEVGRDLTISGTLTGSNSVGGDIYITRNWTRNTGGIYTHNNRTVRFQKNANSIITAPGTGETFGYLRMYKDLATYTVTCSSPVTVVNDLDLNTGVVNTTSTNLLTMTATNSSALIGGSSASYVNGPIKRAMGTADPSITVYNANAEYLFPVGKGVAGNYWPCSVYPTDLPSGAESFQAEFKIGSYSHSILGNLIGVRDEVYWQVDKVTNASSASFARIKLNYITSNNTSNWYPNTLPCYYCNVVVSHAQSNGPTWYDAGFPRAVLTYSTQPPFIEARGWQDATGSLWTIPLKSFSPFGFGYNINQILPLAVQLLQFGGKLQGADGRLDWTVADSKDLTGFELQYSRDGRQFNKLVDIAGNAGSNYSYLHNQLPGGANFYRLLVKEKSGRTFYSNVVLLSVGKLRTQIIGLKENPVHSNISVLIVSAGNQSVSAQVCDALGRNITRSQSQLQAGQNQWTINTQALAKGMYFVQLLTEDGERSTIRFIKD